MGIYCKAEIVWGCRIEFHPSVSSSSAYDSMDEFNNQNEEFQIATFGDLVHGGNSMAFILHAVSETLLLLDSDGDFNSCLWSFDEFQPTSLHLEEKINKLIEENNLTPLNSPGWIVTSSLS